MFMKLLITILTTFLVTSCGGLDPGTLPDPANVHGIITFVGGPQAWPDTLLEVRVVLFDRQPLAPDSVLSAILNGRAAYTDTLPRFVDTCSYSIPIPQPPHTFGYVVVAARVGPNLIKDWMMLSLYHDTLNQTEPRVLSVSEGAQARVDFTVDFLNLPPQPFQ